MTSRVAKLGRKAIATLGDIKKIGIDLFKEGKDFFAKCERAHKSRKTPPGGRLHKETSLSTRVEGWEKMSRYGQTRDKKVEESQKHRNSYH